MNKRNWDLLLCNWPLLGLPIIIASLLTNNFSSHPGIELLLGICFGGGWLIAVIYGFYRLSQQRFRGGHVVLWVIGLLWFSVISLPWLYWKYLKKQPAV